MFAASNWEDSAVDEKKDRAAREKKRPARKAITSATKSGAEIRIMTTREFIAALRQPPPWAKP